MMRCTLQQPDLAACLQIANKVIKGNPQLPILANLSFQFYDDHLQVTATDLITSLSLAVPIQRGSAAKLLVSGSQLLEYVQTLAPQEISLEIVDTTLTLAQGGSSARVPTQDAKDYPDIAFAQPEARLELPTAEFRQLLRLMAMGVAADETRPVLTGVFIKPSADGKSWQWVATDGYRLSLVTRPLSTTWSRELLVPFKPLHTMVKDIKADSLQVGFESKQNQLWLKTAGQQVGIRLLAGDYPPFNKILPTSFATEVTTTRAELLQAVKQMAVFARQNANIVKVDIQDQLQLSTKQGIAGAGRVALDVEREGEPLITAFNFRYLQEYLNTIEEGGVTFSLNGPKTPVQFVAQKHPDLIHIIMPVDLKE